MSIEGVPAAENVDSWEVVSRETPRGVVVRFIGRYAAKRCDMRDVRNKVHDTLVDQDVNDNRIDAALSVVGEFTQNVLRYSEDEGEGTEENERPNAEVEVDVIVTPGRLGSRNDSMVDIAVANRVPAAAVRADGTLEGMDFRGEDGKVVVDMEDPEALLAGHGYGLRAIVDESTGGRWGYNTLRKNDGRSAEVVMYATLAALGDAGVTAAKLDEAA